MQSSFTMQSTDAVYNIQHNFNLQILAKHESNDDIVGEQKFRSIK